MLKTTLNYVSHHAIAIVALVCSLLALAGASYAAIKLPKNSVGNAQIQRGAVAPPKFSKAIGGYVRAFAKIDLEGHLQSASPQARLVGWHVNSTGVSGGTIEWKTRTTNRCVALSTAQDYFSGRVPTDATLIAGSKTFRTGVSVQMSAPSGVSVAVIC